MFTNYLFGKLMDIQLELMPPGLGAGQAIHRLGP